MTENGNEISKIDSLVRSISDISLMGIIDLSVEEDIHPVVKKTIVKSSSRNIYTQKQILHSLVASFRIYETINRAEKLFTVKN